MGQEESIYIVVQIQIGRQIQDFFLTLFNIARFKILLMSQKNNERFLMKIIRHVKGSNINECVQFGADKKSGSSEFKGGFIG